MRLPFAHLYVAAAIALVPASDARASRTKRDSVWVPSDPQAFEVNLSFDKAGRYLAPIGMGKPFAFAGNFSFLLSTSSPYTAVAAAGCETCVAQLGGAPVYDVSKSPNATRLNTTQAFNIGNGSMAGAVVLETCSFKKAKGGNWAYDNQTVLMVQNTSGIFADGVSGFVGLGRSTGNTSLMSGIINNKGWKNLTFGFAFNSFNASASNSNTTAQQSAGSFTVREVDSAQFAGEISWQPLARTAGVPKNVPTDWAIKFDSYKVQSGNQSITNSGGVAIIEPYFQELRIPRDEAVEFFNGITGSTMTDDGSSLSWAVPCDRELTLSVAVGGNTFRIKKEQLISLDSTGTVCTSLLKGWSDPGVLAYVFGAPFATTAYIAYNAYPDPSKDQIGLAPRSAENITVVNQGVSKTVLIAAIVGSTVFTAILASIVLFVFYRRRRASDTPKTRDAAPNVEEKYKIEPFVGGVPNSATPILSTTTRQNGWIIEQGPIGGEPSEGSMLTHDRGSMLRSPQSLDSKRATQSSHLLSMRQSQYTDMTIGTPPSGTTPNQESFHLARPSPSLDHSFRGSRVVSFHGVPEDEHEGNLVVDESAPPPYQPQRDEANTQATGSSSRSRQKN